mmetsp:Transcript_93205/g.182700  ORF Transcript_93205/g.182700 Transcript_93205/m.182700 type:complete len:86 (+) Transcript_93205:1591-1848(+)
MADIVGKRSPTAKDQETEQNPETNAVVSRHHPSDSFRGILSTSTGRLNVGFDSNSHLTELGCDVSFFLVLTAVSKFAGEMCDVRF